MLVASGMATVGKSINALWVFISATRLPGFKSCWIARCICQRIGPTIRRAEKNLRPRRNRVSHQAADRVGADQPRSVQWCLRSGLDVRRTVRSRRQISRCLGRTPADLCSRDSRGLSRLGAKAKSAVRRSKKYRTSERISSFGRRLPFQRGSQSRPALTGVSQPVLAAISNQGYRQRSRSVGSQVDRVLAQRPSGFADTASLSPCRSQRVERRSENTSYPIACHGNGIRLRASGSHYVGCCESPLAAGRSKVAFAKGRKN